jgi:hypothetical protein
MTAIAELTGRLLSAVLAAGWNATPAGMLALVGLVGALGLVTVAAAAALRSVAALAASLRRRPVLSRPVRPPAGWLLAGESDPDADGHARPRAPSTALQAV